MDSKNTFHKEKKMIAMLILGILIGIILGSVGTLMWMLLYLEKKRH